jgi:hypothetical protein
MLIKLTAAAAAALITFAAVAELNAKTTTYNKRVAAAELAMDQAPAQRQG